MTKSVTREYGLKTKGNCDVLNLSGIIGAFIDEMNCRNGLLNVFVQGSTASITTIEFEPGLVQDISDVLDKIIPAAKYYKHHERWGDDNGHSHLRAALIGPSVTIPISNGKPLLGTWQQVVLIDFDTSSRDRKVFLTFVGDRNE